MTRTLLGIDSNAKTVKGQKRGFLTGILYLAPADTSRILLDGSKRVYLNLCPFASAGCKAGCLNTAGRASFTPSIGKARIRKTREMFKNRAQFVGRLCRDIGRLIRKAERLGLTPCVRLNGTSDLPWLPKLLAPLYPTVQFYDYTKIPRPHLREMPNYHLTFSLSENNWEFAQDALAHGNNVAAVFTTKRGQELPTEFRGHRVIDGDSHDLRFIDGHQGVIIGLRAKGKARKDSHGFVQIAGAQ